MGKTKIASIGKTNAKAKVLKIKQALAKSKSSLKRAGGRRAFMATGMEARIATVLNGKPASI